MVHHPDEPAGLEEFLTARTWVASGPHPQTRRAMHGRAAWCTDPSPRRSGRRRCRSRPCPRDWPSRRASNRCRSGSWTAPRPGLLPNSVWHRSAGVPGPRPKARRATAAGSRSSVGRLQQSPSLFHKSHGVPSALTNTLGSIAPPSDTGHTNADEESSTNGPAGLRAHRPRDAHCAARPVGGRDTSGCCRLRQAPQGDRRWCRVVEDVGAIRLSPHRRRPLKAGDCPFGKRGQCVPQILTLESRVTRAELITGTCAPGA